MRARVRIADGGAKRDEARRRIANDVEKRRTSDSCQPFKPAPMTVGSKDGLFARYAADNKVGMEIAIPHVVVHMDDVALFTDRAQMMEQPMFVILGNLVGYMRMKDAYDSLSGNVPHKIGQHLRPVPFYKPNIRPALKKSCGLLEHRYPAGVARPDERPQP